MNTKILAEVFSETDLTYIQQLDERQYRLYCATRAISIGKHGVAAVCASIHISKNTIYRGIRELNGKTILSSETVRIAGGGRKAILESIQNTWFCSMRLFKNTWRVFHRMTP